MRINEALAVRWRHVSNNKIQLPASITKTREARDVELAVSPTALPATHAEPNDYIVGLTDAEVRAARKRLVEFGAPDWSPHKLRRTCGTFLSCAPGIYGGASAYMSARRLGHSVAIAEKHYVGQVTVPFDVTALEAAMGL